jgi:hypothetical protein
VGRRRRAVEQASLRQTVTDRVVIGVLVVVAASGLMSLLPAYSQGVVSRMACQAASLGLGDCGRSSAEADLATTQLGPARCSALADLDAVLPQVTVRPFTTDLGLTLQIAQARNGDVWVWVDEPAGDAPPDLLGGEAREGRGILPGVSVSEHTTWWLPRGQGLDELVASLAQQHRRWATERSALALTSSIFSGSDTEVPSPTLLTSQVRLDHPTLPAPPESPTAPPAMPPGPNKLTVDPSSPSRLVANTITERTSLVVDLRGNVQGQPATGALRVDRDAAGAVTAVLIGVVSPARLVPGESGADGGPGVAYISIAIRSAAEQQLVEDWLSAPAGFSVDIRQLLGLVAAEPDDQLGTFLSRAATVTLLRYDAGDAEALGRQVRTELEQQRRTEWHGAELSTVGAVAPQPSGAIRTLVEDPSCLR